MVFEVPKGIFFNNFTINQVILKNLETLKLRESLLATATKRIIDF